MGIFSTGANGMKAMLENAAKSVANEATEFTVTNETFTVGDSFEWMAATNTATVEEAANQFLQDMGVMELAYTESTGLEVEYEPLTEEELKEAAAAAEAEFEESCKKACKEEGKCECGKKDCPVCSGKSKAVNEADEEKTEEKKDEKAEEKAEEPKTALSADVQAGSGSKFANTKIVVFIKKVISAVIEFFKKLRQKVVNLISKIKDDAAVKKIVAALKKGKDDPETKKNADIAAGMKVHGWDEKITKIDGWDSIVDFAAIDRLGGQVGNYKAKEKPAEEKKEEAAKEEKKEEAKNESFILEAEEATDVKGTILKAFGISSTDIEASQSAVYAVYSGVLHPLGNPYTESGIWKIDTIISALESGPKAQAKAVKALNSMEARIKKVLEGLEAHMKQIGINFTSNGYANVTKAQSLISEIHSVYVAAAGGLAQAMCGYLGETRNVATKLVSGFKVEGDSEDKKDAKAEDKKEEPAKEEKKEESVKEEDFDFLGAFNAII